MIQAETLELLEWPRLCEQLATFASTKLGAIAARHLPIAKTQSESKELLWQTEAACQMELRLIEGWSFGGITDIGEALERAQRGGILSGDELLSLATTLAGMRRLRRAINSQEDLTALIDLVQDIRTYPELEQEIHHCIDDDGKVAERASPKLTDIRAQLKTLRQRIYQKLNSLLQQKGNAVQESVITQRGDRFTIPVKVTHRDHIPGIIHDTSSTGATLYVEPHSIVEMGNKLRQYRRQEQVEEERIFRQLTEKVTEVLPDLELLLAVATKLDLANAKAKYSLWLEANPPSFTQTTETEWLNLRQLRHPLLIWQEKHEQGNATVPIDVHIPPSIRTVTLTGPNTGGKTVTLKTIALATLMAKVGLFIPAKAPVALPWFEQVLADIGDEQSLEQNLSTFSGHIRRISRILAALKTSSTKSIPQETEASQAVQGAENPILTAQRPGSQSQALDNSLSPSLVLLDEVGAGTDPTEGSALAIALLKHLADHTLLTLATTHYGELKALKYQDDRFENASVEFDEQSLSPTYRLLWGIPGRSNALAIAERLGLDLTILQQAKHRLGGFVEEINVVISGLEKQRREQEAKAAEAKQLLQQTEEFYEEVSGKATALQQREKQLKQNQEIAVQEAIRAAKADVAQVIRQLQRGKQTAQKAQQATNCLNEIAEKYLPVPKKNTVSYQPKIGEKIRIPRLGQVAEVLSIATEAGEASVRFGLMKMTVALSEIESLDGKTVDLPSKPKITATKTALTKSKAAKTPSTQSTSADATKPPIMVRTSENTVDLRGNRVNEAESQLETAINRASEQRVLWIIHGKGTGRLREGVHEFLANHPQVQRFELASQNEGGNGVTIAYLD